MKRLMSFIIVAFLFLPNLGHSTVWYGNDSLRKVSLPPEYSGCEWIGATDFAQIRDVTLPAMYYTRKAADFTTNVALGLLIGGAFWGEEAAAKLGAGIIIGYLGNASTEIAGWGFDKWNWSQHANPAALMHQVDIMKNDLGISDHYVFSPVECGDIISKRTILPLGAWVNLKIMPDAERKTILKLAIPEVDYQSLNARVWERNIDGKYQKTTIPKVFGYEVSEGKTIRGPNNALWTLPVVPDSPEKGGKVTGKIWLKSLDGIGHGGIREVHVASPVNRGVIVKKVDDFVLAIVLDGSTMDVKGPRESLEVGKEHTFSVHIKGFHTGASKIVTSDGQSYSWERLANAVFERTTCKGAGVGSTYINHYIDRRYTDVRCVPSQPGLVNVAMQSKDGEFVIANSTAIPQKKVAQKEEDPRHQILGTWRWFNGATVTIGGGNFTVSTGQSGSWECTDMKKRRFKLTWNKHDKLGGPWYDDLTLSSDGKSLDGNNQTGTHVWGRKK
jgi:hypothetical protein